MTHRQAVALGFLKAISPRDLSGIPLGWWLAPTILAPEAARQAYLRLCDQAEGKR